MAHNFGSLVATDNRVALITVDYPAQARLKMLGRIEIFEGAAAGTSNCGTGRGEQEAWRGESRAQQRSGGID